MPIKKRLKNARKSIGSDSSKPVFGIEVGITFVTAPSTSPCGGGESGIKVTSGVVGGGGTPIFTDGVGFEVGGGGTLITMVGGVEDGVVEGVDVGVEVGVVGTVDVGVVEEGAGTNGGVEVGVEVAVPGVDVGTGGLIGGVEVGAGGIVTQFERKNLQ